MKQVEEYDWKRCQIEFVWLSAEDYPKLLQLCDYGVSCILQVQGWTCQ